MDEKPINSPFAELPQLLKTGKIILREPDKAEKPGDAQDTQTKEKRSLFATAMEGVKTLDRKKNRVTKNPPVNHEGVNTRGNSRNLFEEAIREHRNFNVTNLPEYMEGYGENINPLTMEKLRKGDFAVQRCLDLHGHTVDNAGEIFRIFIKDAVRDGLNCVKVIHGRGLKSKGPPVLKEGLKAWIIKAMHRKWVLAFCNAVMRDGGPGATYILLKKVPAKRQIRIMG